MKWENDSFFFYSHLCLSGYVLFLSSHFRLIDSVDASNIYNLTSTSNNLTSTDFNRIGQAFRKRSTCSESQVQNCQGRESLSQLRSSFDTWTNQELPGVDHTVKWWLSLQPWMVSGKAVHKGSMEGKQFTREAFFEKRVGTIGQENKYVFATMLFYIFNVTRTSSIRKR